MNKDRIITIYDLDLKKIIQTETAKFLKECPEQFEKIEEAKDFAWARFTMLANRIIMKAREIET